MRVAHSDETVQLVCDECGQEVLSLVYLGGTNSGPEAPLGDMAAICVKCLREAIIELNVAMGPKVAEIEQLREQVKDIAANYIATKALLEQAREDWDTLDGEKGRAHARAAREEQATLAALAELDEANATVRQLKARLSVLHALWHQDMPAVEEIVATLAEMTKVRG